MKMNGIEVLWYEGEKKCERPQALVIGGKKLMIQKWFPIGVVRDFIGNEREVHKVILEDGSAFKIEYFRNQDQWYVEKLKNW
jgi:hypothetical protein